MKQIIDNIANWLVALKEWKDNFNRRFTSFQKRGKNALIIWSIFLGTFAIIIAFDLYKRYGKLWIAMIPIIFLITFITAILVRTTYMEKMKYRNQNSRRRSVGFNMDFNERILRRIYGSLTKYEYLDENLTSFSNFYNVMVLDFEHHDSVLHFNCTQPQLKYILDRFKQLKKGISLKSFERSQKIYHKGNPISAEVLSKKYNEFPPDQEFEQRIDAAFDFLGDI